MNTLTTNNIKISVISKYEPKHSFPSKNKYVHSYWIKIENEGELTVQLLSREWLIKDANLVIREIKGDGVIGEQPIIEEGDFHQYSSWSPISAPIGQMTGRYKMRRVIDQSIFYVDVPPINMIYPPLNN
ncbi:MAG: Co2+/Mg2+ efflux protein ApaG [Saprospiraceae bacterium]